MHQVIKGSIVINSSPGEVWRYLTEPELMVKWAGEPEMEIRIDTDWGIGNPFVTTGFHHVRFENRGVVLKFEPYRVIQYSQLSSLSRLQDIPEHRSVITFFLEPIDQQTGLTLVIENFPTETIYKHHEFYWQGTLHILKQVIEKR